MSLLRQRLAAALGIVSRDATIFLTYRGRILTQVVSGFTTLVLFYYISRLVTVGTFEDPDDYFAFAVIGLVIVQVLASTLAALPVSIRQELVAGTFERVVVSPFGPIGAIAAMTVFPLALGLLYGAITILLAVGIFDMPLAWSTAPLSLPTAALAAIAFAPFSFFLAASVLAIKQTGAGAGFVVTGISLIGGFFFPVALLPAWIEWASEVQPFTPALDLLRHLLVGTPLAGSAWSAVVKLVLFAAALLPLSLLTLQAALHFAQRRGTVIEY